MTMQETTRLLSLLKTAYPAFGKGAHPANLEALWHATLADVPYAQAQKGFVKLVQSCKFTPTVADLLENINKISASEEGYIAKVRYKVPRRTL
jgi:Loader and inhibitor of phage G40P.